MPVRGLYRGATVKGTVTASNAPVYVDSDDNRLKVIPAGTGSTEVLFLDSSYGIGASGVVGTAAGVKVAGGSGALVSGTAVVATGLATVSGFSWNIVGATGTGAANAELPTITSIATGAVTITAFYVSTIGASGASIISSGSAASYYWTALGT